MAVVPSRELIASLLVASGFDVQRVFVLGPSHHWFTRQCALTVAEALSTPSC